MKVCVSCQADVEGKRAVRIREDRIIKGIRAVKQVLRIAQNNELYVCDGCMPKHLERRRSFEKTMLFASIVAGLMLVLIILAPLLSGRFDPVAILSGLVVAVFLLSLPIFKYTPAVEGISASAFSKAPPLPAPQPPLPVVPGERKTAPTRKARPKKSKNQ